MLFRTSRGCCHRYKSSKKDKPIHAASAAHEWAHFFHISATLVTPLSRIQDGSFAPSGYPELAFSVDVYFNNGWAVTELIRLFECADLTHYKKSNKSANNVKSSTELLNH